MHGFSFIAVSRLLFQYTTMLKPQLFLLLLLVVFSCNSPTEEQETRNPNVVFLFADDMTYHAIRALGNEEINTPNLDKLVRGGTTFTHAYNMGGWNGAICVASRSMMITGQYVWRAKQLVDAYGKENPALESNTWGQWMKQQGYDTYMTGKWHVKVPAPKVFDVAEHIRPGMPGDNRGLLKFKQWKEEAGDKEVDWDAVMPPGYNRPLSENDDSWSPTDSSFGGFWEGGKHWSEVVKDDAVSFIQQATQKENPFFMYLAFNAPHDPRQAPQSFIDQYPLENISIPPNWQPEYPGKEAIGAGRTLRDEALGPFPRTEYATKVHIQEYYAIITHLDEQIGKIIQSLEENGQLDNTYIFFSADHGLAAGQHGLLGKQNMYDHSVRVPLVVMGPDIPAGNKVAADVYLQDIMASSLELAGIEEAPVEFHSLLDLAKGTQTQSNYEAIYGCYVQHQRMIRKNGYKLIVYPKLKQVKLFDLQSDPAEKTNLAGESDQAERLAGLFNDLVQLQQEMDDELDLGTLENYQSPS